MDLRIHRMLDLRIRESEPREGLSLDQWITDVGEDLVVSGGPATFHAHS